MSKSSKTISDEDARALIAFVKEGNLQALRKKIENILNHHEESKSETNFEEVVDLAYGATMLAWAEFKGHKDIVSYLLELQPSLANQFDNNHYSVFHEAARMVALNDFDAILDLLIQNCDEINAQTYRGDTALHIAVRNNHISMVKKLIENSAHLYLKNELGYTACGQLTLLSYLKEEQIQIKKLLEDAMAENELKAQTEVNTMYDYVTEQDGLLYQLPKAVAAIIPLIARGILKKPGSNVKSDGHFLEDEKSENSNEATPNCEFKTL